MKIKIIHSTTYRYSSIVPKLTQCLKLYPSLCDNQEIIEWKILSSNGKIVESHTDALGHRIQNIFINNFSGNLLVKTKKMNIYGLNIGMSNQLGLYKPFVGGSLYWKIGKK